MKNKVKSFTLAELLVVMIITVLIVGLAFMTLGLVKKEINEIEGNFNKSASLLLLEQRLSQDFNKYSRLTYESRSKKLEMFSDVDSATYYFGNDFTLRNKDTIHLKLQVNALYYHGKKAEGNRIDAMHISCGAEFPDYDIFVFGTDDTTNLMNTDGF